MTAALAMSPHALQACRVEAPDAMAKIRAAIKAAPKIEMTAEERALVAENRRRGYPGISAEDFMARVDALPEDDGSDDHA
jgi:hypothetical protein